MIQRRFHICKRVMFSAFFVTHSLTSDYKMAGTVLTDGEDGPRIGCPQHNNCPSAALLAHSEQAAIASQQKAVNNFCAAEAAKRESAIALALNAAHANKSTTL